MRSLKEIITLTSFETEDIESTIGWIIWNQGLRSFDIFYVTQHFLLFYEFVFQQNIKWCEKNFRENILFKKPKEIWKTEHHWRADWAQILRDECEREKILSLLLLWGKSLMSKCLVSWKETRFQLSHPIAWKERVT